MVFPIANPIIGATLLLDIPAQAMLITYRLVLAATISLINIIVLPAKLF